LTVESCAAPDSPKACDIEACAIPDPFAGPEIYRTPPDKRPSLPARVAPSLFFYSKLYGIVRRSCSVARRGLHTGKRWAESSIAVVRALEDSGARIEIEGLEHVRNLRGPVVYVANHMSTAETFMLPGILRPHRPVTFVVKAQLLDYPLFGPLMRATRPIAVGRANPREDLVKVIEEGTRKLSEGISIIVFPQTTRCDDFDPARFNSIGAKLAARAKVDVVPVAIKTNAWGTGRWLKDFGKFRPEIPIRFRFGAPIPPEGKGDAAHKASSAFIENALREWKD
jgi:1-acyl-sn-glycerol-3-phosphate acyltransferase